MINQLNCMKLSRGVVLTEYYNAHFTTDICCTHTTRCADMMFVKTLADFGPIMFYSKASNSRHIKFCDKAA